MKISERAERSAANTIHEYRRLVPLDAGFVRSVGPDAVFDVILVI
jgi:hypothetical protein